MINPAGPLPDRPWPGIIRAYSEFLSLPAGIPIITLLEGGTPLVRAQRLSALLGLEVYFKIDGSNPTGSFKDRGMTVAVTMAVAEGANALICAATGNTAASAAAYAARAGLGCYVVVPEGKAALPRLSESLIHGARVLAIEGDFERALSLVEEVASRHPVALVNSRNPHRLEGQKTAAFEICDALGRAPNYVAVPVGTAGNFAAIWRGFREYRDVGRTATVPQMLGFHAAGAATQSREEPVSAPQTIASSIRIGPPANWEGAVNAARESGGLLTSVEDSEIVTAYKYLAREEGVFAEPAAAASVAGLMKLAREKFFAPGELAVAVLTGHGLKDPATAGDSVASAVSIPARLEALEEILAAAGREVRSPD